METVKEMKELVNEEFVPYLIGDVVTKTISSNYGEMFELKKAIDKTLSTSSSIKGKEVMYLVNNLFLLDNTLAPIVNKQNELVDKYVEKDNEGKPKNINGLFHFSKPEDKESYDKQSDELWNEKIDLLVCKIPFSVFNEMELNTKENNTFMYLVNWLVKD